MRTVVPTWLKDKFNLFPAAVDPACAFSREPLVSDTGAGFDEGVSCWSKLSAYAVFSPTPSVSLFPPPPSLLLLPSLPPSFPPPILSVAGLLWVCLADLDRQTEFGFQLFLKPNSLDKSVFRFLVLIFVFLDVFLMTRGLNTTVDSQGTVTTVEIVHKECRVAGWPRAPEISTLLFSLRSGHPDFVFLKIVE